MNKTEYGVIVKFGENKYSFKTPSKCYWCRQLYWKKDLDIINEFPHIYFVTDDNISNLVSSGTLQKDIYELFKKYSTISFKSKLDLEIENNTWKVNNSERQLSNTNKLTGNYIKRLYNLIFKK